MLVWKSRLMRSPEEEGGGGGNEPEVFKVGDDEYTAEQITVMKNNSMLHSDYTTKTTTLAEERKAFETERAEFEKTRSSAGNGNDNNGGGNKINTEVLKRLEKVEGTQRMSSITTEHKELGKDSALGQFYNDHSAEIIKMAQDNGCSLTEARNDYVVANFEKATQAKVKAAEEAGFKRAQTGAGRTTEGPSGRINSDKDGKVQYDSNQGMNSPHNKEAMRQYTASRNT